MAPISPADTNLVPRREFIRDQRPASSFSILALSGAALLRLYSFPTDAVFELRKHLDSAHLILSSRELIQDNFYELSLEGKPWSNPKSMRSEKLLVEIIDTIHRTGHNFLSTLDYGREQDDRIIMAFSRTPPSPPPQPQPPPIPGASPSPSHGMSNESLSVASHPVKLLFAISFLSQNHLRVIAPPLHLTPAILRTVRGSWPRGVVSEKKVAENVYEFKLKGYRWFQEDTFPTDSLRHILSMLSTLDGFGFTLLTSLSLNNNRSRSKDLWLFTGLSQPNSLESQSSSPLGSRTELHAASSDKARERRRSYQAPAHSPTATNRPSHTRAATEGSVAALSHNPPPPGPTSSKSGIVRKPAPRAQLPVSVAHSTGSNYNVHDGVMPPARSTPSEELGIELQSSVGSAVDMTGIGTQKYGREPDTSLYQQAPSKFYSVSPGFTHHYPSMSASIMKASQPGESLQGVQTTGRTKRSSTTREPNTSSISLRSRHPPLKTTPQPVTPLLSPGAFRDSAISSNTGQTVDVPSTWPGAGKEHAHSGSGVRSRDPRENVLPSAWISASGETRESPSPGDHPEESNVHHALRPPPNLRLEEQEVKVSVPELVHPRHRLLRSGEATLVSEAPRVDTHRMKSQLSSPTKLTSDKKDNESSKTPAEGWVLVSYGQTSTASAPQVPKPTSRPSLRRKQSFPPTRLQKPPLGRSPYSTGARGAPADSPVGNGHKKASSNPNPSSMSSAAKALVIIDAVQAKRKGTSGDAPQSSFRKFFSLNRPESPKSPSKEDKVALSSSRGKGKMAESEDNTKKRERTRERWHVRRMSELPKSDRRMSVE